MMRAKDKDVQCVTMASNQTIDITTECEIITSKEMADIITISVVVMETITIMDITIMEWEIVIIILVVDKIVMVIKEMVIIKIEDL